MFLSVFPLDNPHSSRLRNQLIRSREHIRRDRKTYLLCRPEINHQLELLRLLNREIGKLRAFQDSIHVISAAP